MVQLIEQAFDTIAGLVNSKQVALFKDNGGMVGVLTGGVFISRSKVLYVNFKNIPLEKIISIQ